jgi:glycosyltransferase involved in cell wall biosynthesis
MRLVFPLDQRFVQTPDGKVWTETTFPYAYWGRYLEVFDSLVIVARADPVPEAPEQGQAVEGEGVVFRTVPYYLGPAEYTRRLLQVRRCVLGTQQPGDAVLFRMHSAIGSLLEARLARQGCPYGLEVATDPFDALAPGALEHPLRALCRPLLSRTLRRQCARAAAVSYVTRETLQGRYPPGPGAYTTHYSTLELPEEEFASAPREFCPNGHEVTLVTIGSMAQTHKGLDVLIEAVARCRARGQKLRLRVLGEGRYRASLEAQAREAGLEACVEFLGQVPAGRPVLEELDRADLFVLASRTEGLPRSMIEAMARGLPCVGTKVGGIPELLPAEDLVPVGDSAALAEKLGEVLGDAERRNRMAARSLETAQDYRPQVLRSRRRAFYQHLRELTEAWWRGKV